MAQSGYTPILIYASGTTGNTPSAANMTSSASGAELALNYFDGKLFYKDNGGTVKVLAQKSDVITPVTNNGVVYVNSSGQATTGSALTFDGTDFRMPNGGSMLIGASTAGASLILINGTAAAQRLVLGTSGTDAVINATRTSGTSPNLLFQLESSEQMRLTSTGLGIGTSSPSASDWNASATVVQVKKNDTNGGLFKSSSSNTDFIFSAGNNLAYIATTTNTPILFYTNTTERMRLDSSGNLGLGVTPSAWSTAYKAFSFGSSGGGQLASGASNTQTLMSANLVFTGTGATGWKLPNNVAGTNYEQYLGAHKWYNAPANGVNGDATLTQAMTLDASGNLLVGTTSATYSASGRGLVEINGSSTSLLALKTGGSAAGYVYHDGTALSIVNTKASYIQFTTNSIDAARIDSSGNLLVGTTSAAATVVGARIITSTTIPQISVAVSTTSNNYLLYNTTAGAYRFFVSDAGQINATSTSITAISDQSLKENVRDLETGLNEVMALKPRRFDWKEETKIGLTNVAGFIAQEVEQVLPELVQDYQYNDNEIKKSLKMGDILPTLVKAIQEQQAIITSMQSEIDALKQKVGA